MKIMHISLYIVECVNHFKQDLKILDEMGYY